MIPMYWKKKRFALVKGIRACNLKFFFLVAIRIDFCESAFLHIASLWKQCSRSGNNNFFCLLSIVQIVNAVEQLVPQWSCESGCIVTCCRCQVYTVVSIWNGQENVTPRLVVNLLPVVCGFQWHRRATVGHVPNSCLSLKYFCAKHF